MTKELELKHHQNKKICEIFKCYSEIFSPVLNCGTVNSESWENFDDQLKLLLRNSSTETFNSLESNDSRYISLEKKGVI